MVVYTCLLDISKSLRVIVKNLTSTLTKMTDQVFMLTLFAHESLKACT